MQSLVEALDQNHLHHAYGFPGEESLKERMREFIAHDLSFSVSGNPDYYESAFDVLGIEEARALKVRALQTSFSGGKKIFLLAFQSATIEAQNALLKLFEEPPVDTHFFIILPREELLLPTLRSRMIFVRTDSGGKESGIARELIQKSPAERLASVREIIDKKDKAAALALVNFLEREYVNELRSGRAEREIRSTLSLIVRTRGYLLDRSSSLKLLLEELALTLPLQSK